MNCSVNRQFFTSLNPSANETYVDTNMAPYEARPSNPNGWCAFTNNAGQWLAIDLGISQPINKIELVKHNSDTNYVKSFKVRYSDDGQPWTWYNYSEV